MIVDVSGIPLRRRHGSVLYTLCDPDDFALLNDFHWSLGGGGYVKRNIGSRSRQTIYMHRQLLGLTADDQTLVDHINRNRMDNRRANLRLATSAENSQNRGPISGRFRGVTRAADGRWFARAQIAGVVHYLGRFATEDEAGQVASDFRVLHMPYAIEGSTP